MKYTIIRENIVEGLLVKCRNEMEGEDSEAKAIRFGLRSYSNHDAMTARRNKVGEMGINEAVPPLSKWTSFDDYEDMMNRGYSVRFYRLKAADTRQLDAMAHYFTHELLDLPYPKKAKMLLLASRLINAIDKPYCRIRLTWCSQLYARAVIAIMHDAIDGANGKKKNLWTPKTTENRILQGLYVDETDLCVRRSV